MLILSIQFTSGRYHGTPWDAHVNEGRVEWPPSPWRIARALLAVGHGKLGWCGTVPDEAKTLIEAMAQEVPLYHLPSGAESHVRHYMPIAGLDKSGQPNRSKIFDAFFRVNDPMEPLLVAFPALDETHRPLLAQLASGLAYLGRAESWVEAEVLPADCAVEIGSDWCVPVAEDASGARLRLPAPMASEKCVALLGTLAGQESDKAETKAVAKENGKTITPKAIQKARDEARSSLPADLLACLHLDTAQWQKEGWTQPPGLQWVEYIVPTTAVGSPSGLVSPRSQVARNTGAEAVLLSLFGDGNKGAVLPKFERSLPLCESLHAVAAKLSDGHPMLTGCNANRKTAADHRHAHYLPLDLAGSGRVDHVLAWSGDKSQPFDGAALRAISSVSHAYAKDIENLSVRVAGQGSVLEVLKQLSRRADASALQALRPFQSGCLWETVTPLVLRQYINRGYRTPENQIRAELKARGFDEPESIAFWPHQETVKRGLKKFVARRKEGKPQPPMVARWGATLRFKTPQTGPICLGYASHFGLGLFACAD